MANSYEERINLSFTADTSQAKKSIQELQTALQNVAKLPASPVNLIDDSQIKKASQSALELQQHLQNAVNVNTGKLDLSRFSTSLKTSGKDLKEYYKNLLACGTEGQAAFVKLAGAISTAETPVVRMSEKLEKFKTTLTNTFRWQVSTTVLNSLYGSVQKAYGYAQDLNESLNNIRIVTGQSADQMADFAKKANEAAKALSTTTTAYTDAALIFYQQGLTGSDVTDRTNTVIKLANVTGESASEVSSYMTSIWNNFDNGSKSLESYADTITALGAATASSSEEIAEGLEKFSSVANTVGLSYEYATSALATVVAQTRQSADTVGTAFKTLFARIQDLELGNTLDDGTTLGTYSQALQKIGVNIKDAKGEVKDMDDILDEMGAKWDNIDKASQIAVAQAVAGTRQYSQLVALMDNWDRFQTNLNTANSSEGTLQTQADIYAESWEAARDRVTAAAETIYSDLLDDDFFIQITDGFSKFLDAIDGIIDGMGGLKGVLLTVGSAFMNYYSKQMPDALNNLKQNFFLFTNQAQKAMTTVQQDTSNFLGEIISDPNSSTTMKVQAEGLQKVNQMQQSLTLNMRNMTQSEQEAYKARIQNVQAIYQEIEALAKKNEELQKEFEATSKAAQSTARSATVRKFSDVIADKKAAEDENESLKRQKKSIAGKKGAQTAQENRNKTEYENEKTKLDEDHTNGNLSDENYQEKIAKLEEEKKKKEAEIEQNRSSFEEQEKSIDNKIGFNNEDIENAEAKLEELKNLYGLTDEEIKQIIADEGQIKNTKTWEKMSSAIKESSDKLKDIITKQKQIEPFGNNLKSQSEEWAKNKKEIKESAKESEKVTNNIKELTNKAKKLAEENKEAFDTDAIELMDKIINSDDESVEDLIDDFERLSQEVNATIGSEILPKLETEQDNLRKKMNQQGYNDPDITNMERTANNSADAGEDLNHSIENSKDITEEAAEGTFHLSEAIMDFGSTAMSVIGVLESFKELGQTFQDVINGDGDAIDLLTGFIGTLMVTVQAANALMQLSQAIGRKDIIIKGAQAAATGVATGAQEGLNAACYSNPYVLIAAAIIALTAVLVAFTIEANKAAEAMSAEGLYKQAKEGAEDASEALNQVKSAYSSLVDTLEDLETRADTIDTLTRGTVEWRQAIIESNEALIDLLESYDMLNKENYTINADGLMEISDDAKDKLTDSMEEAVIQATNANYAAKVNLYETETAAAVTGTIHDSDIAGMGFTDFFRDNYGLGIAGAAGVDGGLSLGTAGAALGLAGIAAPWAILSNIFTDGKVFQNISDFLTGSLSEEKSEDIGMAISEAINSGELDVDLQDKNKIIEVLTRDANISEQQAETLAENISSNEDLIESLNENASLVAQNTEAIRALNNETVTENFSSDIESSGLSDEEQEYLTNLMGSELGALSDKLYEEKYKDKGAHGNGMTDEEVQKLYAEAMGWSTEVIDNLNGDEGNRAVYYTTDGEEVGTIADSVARKYLAQQEAIEQLGGDIDTYINTIKDLISLGNKIGDGVGDALASLAGGSDGDFSDLTGSELETFKNNVDVENQTLNGEKITEEKAASYSFTSVEAFFQAIENGIKSYEESIENISTELGEYGLEDSFKKLKDDDKVSKTGASAIKDILLKAYGQAGSEGASEVEELIEEYQGENVDAFIQTLNNIDWDTASVSTFRDTMRSAGIETNYTDEDIEKYIEELRTQKGIVQDLTTTYKSTHDIIDKLKDGSTITSDNYNTLFTQFGDAIKSYFLEMADGTYKLTIAAQEFYDVIENNLETDFENNIEQISKVLNYDYDDNDLKGKAYTTTTTTTKVALSNDEIDAKTEEIRKNGYKYYDPSTNQFFNNVKDILPDSNLSDEDSFIKAMVDKGNWKEVPSTADYSSFQDFMNYYLVDQGNAYRKATSTSTSRDLDLAQAQIDLLSASGYSELDDIKAANLTKWKEDIENNTITVEELNDLAEATSTYGLTIDELNAKLEENQEEYASTASNLSELHSMLDEGLISVQAFTKAALAMDEEQDLEGLDTDELADYVEYLQEAGEYMDGFNNSMSKDEAQRVAKGIMKMNSAIETLSENFVESADNENSWLSILKKSSKSSQEYAEAMINTKEAIADLLDINSEFVSSDFIRDHFDDISKAATGSAEAIDGLKDALSEELVETFSNANASSASEAETFRQQMQSILDQASELGDVEAGVTFYVGGEDSFVDSLNEMINETEMTVDQVNALCDSMGFEANFASDTEQVSTKVPEYSTVYTRGPVTQTEDGGSTWTETSRTEVTAYRNATGDVPVYAMTTDGSTPKIKSVTKKASGSANNYSSSNSGGSSASGAKKNTSKRDTSSPTLYKDTEHNLNLLDTAINKLDKDQDHLAGNALIQSLQQENELIEQQVNDYDSLLSQIKEVKENRASELSAFGDVGTDSYNDIYANIQKAYNNAVDTWNSMSADEQEASEDAYGQTYLDRAKDEFDKRKQYLDDYYDAEEKEATTAAKKKELLYQQIENNLEAHNVEIQLKLDLTEVKRTLNDFLKDISIDFTRSFKSALEWDSIFDTDEKDFNTYLEDAQTHLTDNQNLKDMYANGQWGGKDDLYASEDEILQAIVDSDKQLIEDGNTAKAAYETAYNDLCDCFETVDEQFDDILGKIEDISDTLDFYSKVNELLNGEDTTEGRQNAETIYAAQKETSLTTQGALYQHIQDKKIERQALIDQGFSEDNSEVAAIDKEISESTSKLQSEIENYIDVIQKELDNSINMAMDTMETNLFGNKISDIQEDWERRTSLAEGYYNEVERTYQLQNLESKWEQAYNKASLSTQQKMKALEERRLKLLREKNQLSEDDVKLAEKELAIAEAQIALEDAQSAKNSMKLTRDANGNWSYQYIADAEKVAEAESNLATANNDYYTTATETTENSIKTYLEQMTNLRTQLSEATAAGDTEKINQIKQDMEEYSKRAAEEIQYLMNVGDEALAEEMLTLYEQAGGDMDNFEQSEIEFLNTLSDNGITTLDDLVKYLGTGDDDGGIYSQIISGANKMNSECSAAWNSLAASAMQSLIGSAEDGSLSSIVSQAFSEVDDALEDYQKAIDDSKEAMDGWDWTQITDGVNNTTSGLSNLNEQLNDISDWIKNNAQKCVDKVAAIRDAWKQTADNIETAVGDMEDYQTALKDTQAAAADVVGDDRYNGSGDINTDIDNGGNDDDTDDDDTDDTQEEFKLESKDRTGHYYYLVSSAYGSGKLGLYDETSKEYVSIGGTKEDLISKAGTLNMKEAYTYQTDPNGVQGTYSLYHKGKEDKTITGSLEDLRKQLLKKGVISSFDTGGYTGEWNSGDGRLAMLHSKEIVLNSGDTSNLLSAVSAIRDISSLGSNVTSSIASGIVSLVQDMLGFKTNYSGTSNASNSSETGGNTFNITAEFPNANDVDSIREAILSLPNLASQYLSERKL